MSFFDKLKKKDEKENKKDVAEKDNKTATDKADAPQTTSKNKVADSRKEEIKNEKKGDEPSEKTSKTDNKVWHITKREEDGMWQIKAEGASRATKLFKTKAEAEDYVKTLKSNNEGSRVVRHKKTGEFQKK